MKKIYKLVILFVLVLSSRSFSQAPVMFPISGPTAVCSAPAPTSNYSSSAINSPTTYVWSVMPSAGVVIGSPNASSTSISFPTSNGTYTVSCYATNSFGASAPVNFVVNVYQTPIITFSGANSFCQGSSTNISASSTLLSGSSTISYNWSPSTGLNTTTGPSVTASPASTTTYVVTGTIGFCSNSSTIAVNVLPVPFITTVASPSAVCTGNQASNTASGANTYTWSNGVLNGALFTPPSTASYTVIGKAVNGCTNSAVSNIAVNPLPVITVSTNSAVICAGQSATLAFTGTSVSYSLNSAASGTSAVVSPSVSTTYTVSGVTSQGCVTSKTFTQNVSSCAGVHELTAAGPSNVKAFPNPAANYFNLRSSKDESVVIVNEFGQIVRTIELTADTETTVTGLASGMYFIVAPGVRIKIAVLTN